jgi:hypothetical protein
MCSDNAKKALAGEEAWIEGDQLRITEAGIIEVTGGSCTVVDSQGNDVVSFVKKGSASVKTGYRCDVMKAWVKFTKD